MFLEEALLRASLWATHEADGPIGSEGQHDGGNSFVVIGKLALGLPAIGKDDPIAAGNFNHGSADWGDFGLIGPNAFCVLVATEAKIASMADIPFGGEFGKGDFGDQFWRHPCHAACAGLVRVDRRGLPLQPA